MTTIKTTITVPANPDLDNCLQGAVFEDCPWTEFVDIDPALGDCEDYETECERLESCWDRVTKGTPIAVYVRPARQGEAQGFYAIRSDRTLQILGYSVPRPEAIERLASEAWDLYCQGS